jgi:hypothetical protein
MKSLQDLRVILIFHHPDWNKLSVAETAAMLEPLMEVTTPKCFKVNLPSYLRVDVPWEELPCIVGKGLNPILGEAL